MTTTPPNWQWCQGLTEEERKQYHDKVNGKVRTIRKAAKAGLVDVVNFVDNIPTPTSDYAICVIPANDYALQHLKKSYNSIKKYAEKCGADYIELTGDQHPDWPMANKYRLHKVTSTYKKTLYLDCDVIVNDIAPNIFEVTPDDKISIYDELPIWDFVNDEISGMGWITQEQHNIVHKYKVGKHKDIGKRMYNGGVMVVPKDLADLYKQPEDPYPSWWCWDQQYMTMGIDKKQIHLLDEKFNWEYLRSDFWEGVEESYFIHINGEKNQEYRVALMQRLANGLYDKFDSVKRKQVQLAPLWGQPTLVGYNAIVKRVDDTKHLPQTKKQNLVISIATGKAAKKVSNVSRPLLEKYADKCSADLIILDNETQDWWGWEKFRVGAFIPEYDRTLMIDADMLVSEHTPNVFDIVPRDKVGINCEQHKQTREEISKRHKLRIKAVKEIFSRRDADKILAKDVFEETSKDLMMLNSGFVVFSKEHAHILDPVITPCHKTHFTEQFAIECRVILEDLQYILPETWNYQMWYPKNSITDDELYESSERTNYDAWSFCATEDWNNAFVKHFSGWHPNGGPDSHFQTSGKFLSISNFKKEDLMELYVNNKTQLLNLMGIEL